MYFCWLSGKTVGIYAYNLHSLNKKNLTSDTPLNAALKDLILELNDSAKALVALLIKKFGLMDKNQAEIFVINLNRSLEIWT